MAERTKWRGYELARERADERTEGRKNELPRERSAKQKRISKILADKKTLQIVISSVVIAQLVDAAIFP